MKDIRYRLIFLILILGSSCQNSKNGQSFDEDEFSNGTEEVIAPSTLSIPLNFPLSEIDLLINKVLPEVLLDDTIHMKKEGDFIKLNIQPSGKLFLNSYGNKLDASLPLKVTASLSKKVVGVKVKTKEPIDFELRADLHTDLSIDHNWEMVADCKIQDIKWITSPKTKLLGINVNLEKLVEKSIRNNEEKITGVVCTSLGRLVPIKEQVTKIWDILTVPHRVAKNPVDIWLTSRPTSFSAQFDKSPVDTIRAIVRTETEILISPEAGINFKQQKMPANQFDKGIPDDLNLKAKLYVPYVYANELLNSKLGDKKLSYQGFAVNLNDFNTSHNQESLVLQFGIVGDVSAKVKTNAIPVLDDSRSLGFERLDFEIESENPLVKVLDMVANKSLAGFVKTNTNIPLAPILDSLDHKIMLALNKSNLGQKLDIDLEFTSLTSDSIMYFDDRFEWWFDIDGTADAYLNAKVVNK